MSKGAEIGLYTTVGYEAPPETREQKREREERAWIESIQIRSDAPPVTTADYLRPKGRWKDVKIIAAELREAELKAIAERKREAEAPTLRIIEEPIL